jgi:hypothetical protein
MRREASQELMKRFSGHPLRVPTRSDKPELEAIMAKRTREPGRFERWTRSGPEISGPEILAIIGAIAVAVAVTALVKHVTRGRSGLPIDVVFGLVNGAVLGLVIRRIAARSERDTERS